MFRCLILIAGIVTAAHAFGNGAPTSVCGDLTPKHPADPQKGPSPYVVSINKDVIRPGDEVEVTIKSPNGKKFKGFLIEAVKGDTIIGSFAVGPKDKEVQTIDCPNGKKNAATHRNSEEKSQIKAKWIASGDHQGIVQFKATIVENGLTFWTGQMSPEFTVRK